VLGVICKIQHFPYGGLLLGLSALASLGFIIPGLADVFDKVKYKLHEKLMWTVGFIFLSWIAGFLYWPEFKKERAI
jgi:hypothetical protein